MTYQVQVLIKNLPESDEDYQEEMSKLECALHDAGFDFDIGIGEEE